MCEHPEARVWRDRAELTTRRSHPNTVSLVQEQYSGNNVENRWGKNILIRYVINQERTLKWYCSV